MKILFLTAEHLKDNVHFNLSIGNTPFWEITERSFIQDTFDILRNFDYVFFEYYGLIFLLKDRLYPIKKDHYSNILSKTVDAINNFKYYIEK